MKESNLQKAVDAAWDLIVARVAKELGKAEDRPLRRLATVTDVDESSRVFLREIHSGPSASSPFGSGTLTESGFRASMVTMHHRRYALPLSEDDLWAIVRKTPESRVEEVGKWAKAVLRHEGRKLLESLVAASGVSVSMKVSSSLGRKVRIAMNNAGHAVSDRALDLVVVEGRLSDELREDLPRVLGGGRVVKLQVGDPLPRHEFGVVIDTEAVLLDVYQAIDLALGWDVSAGGIEILLDQRASAFRLPGYKAAAIVQLRQPQA